MTLGVLALNVLLLLSGAAVLYAARGWEWWRDVLRDLGLAYILGLATIGVGANLALVLGLPLSGPTIVVLVALTLAAGAAVGVRRSRPVPRAFGRRFALPRTVGDLLTAIAAAITLALALAIYAAFRHQPLIAYDAWNFWIPKAKTIYFFNGIDNHLFTTLPAPSYPLFVPALDAMVFRFAGTTDPSVLAQQDWFVLVGFLGAVAALLAPLARRGIVWLFLAAFLLLPELQLRWFQLLADWTLDAFLVVSALLFARWLITREGWLLAVLPIPLAAMLITKREGQLFILCFVVGALAATAREWRAVWPRVAGLAVLAYLVSQLPWRIWWMAHHLPSDLTEGGTGHIGSLHRAFASAHIVAELLFDRSAWLLAVPLALAAALAVVLVRRVVPATAFYLVTAATLFLGLTWVMWSAPTMPLTTSGALNPTVREVASIGSLSMIFAPLLVSLATERAPLPVFDVPLTRAARNGLPRLRTALVAARPAKVLGAIVVAQWVIVLAIALTVRHQGWIFYQGGDQLWYYTTGWLLAHGQFPPLGVGYLWSILLAPIAAVTGANIANAYPAIVVVQFLLLLPLAPLALYGIGRRIGGRLFGYWTAALWLIVPLVAIKYTDAGYHQRFTEVLLPQGFGLTGMADFPTMLAALVSAYYCVRVLAGDLHADFNAIAAGVAAGAAFAIKPATALFLVGPALAFLAARRFRAGGLFALALLPAAVALAFAKWRALGYVPVFQNASGVPVAAGPHVLVAAGNPLSHYIPFHWKIFETQLDQVREHFWSVRLVEWLVVAGAVGLAIRSRRYAALIVPWFAAIVILKTGSGRADMEGGNLLRVVMPAYPAFVVLLASLPFLVPGVARRVPVPAPDRRSFLTPRQRLVGLVAALLATAAVPIAAYAAASPIQDGPGLRAAFLQQPPIPIAADVHLTATRSGKDVDLRWQPQRAAGGPVFYHVFRRPETTNFCYGHTNRGAEYCVAVLTDLGPTRSTTFVDRSPPSGGLVYYVGIAANWLNDTTQGDVYVLGRGVAAR